MILYHKILIRKRYITTLLGIYIHENVNLNEILYVSNDLLYQINVPLNFSEHRTLLLAFRYSITPLLSSY